MKQYRLEATPAVELDIEATFDWYEREEAGLGSNFSLNSAPLTQEFSIITSAIRIFARESSRVNSPLSARDLLFD